MKNRKLKNKLLIKYYMRKAGNDSPLIKKEIDTILKQLELILRIPSERI
jgi:hypothetical protein